MTAIPFRKHMSCATEGDVETCVPSLDDAKSVAKAVVDFMKMAENHLKRSWDLIETAHKSSGLSFNEFCDTEAGRQLSEAYYISRKRLLDGPGESIAKSMEPAIERLGSEVAKRVEEFSLAHDLDERAARIRLEEISPSYRELVAEHHEAIKSRATAIETAKRNAEIYRKGRENEQQQKEQEAAAAAERASKRANMTPSEAVIMDRAEKLVADAAAAGKSMTLSKAVTEITNTREGSELQIAANRERTKRMAGIQ